MTATQLMQKTYFIPETMNAWNALQEMRRRRIHMAIVVDEYGGTSGLVTFEDILEEVLVYYNLYFLLTGFRYAGRGRDIR